MMDVFVNPAPQQWESLCYRAAAKSHSDHVAQVVAKIIERVRLGGDSAIAELSQEIDHVQLDSLKISEQELKAAQDEVPEELKDAIALSLSNIRKFHAAQLANVVDIETMPGVRCVQRSVPITRVGLYIPGGSAPLFSTVLMLAGVAKIAGCEQVVLCTPSRNAAVLYAAYICGVDEVYNIGGAQAIAAMAYGTETIRKVDKVFGPGNQYVTQAKQQVSLSQVAIDMPAGPSEVMVLADSSARVDFVAADMLSQAEHGPDSQAILVCHSEAFARDVMSAIELQLSSLSRRDVAGHALDNCRIVVFSEASNQVAFSNVYAPEHLIISMDSPWDMAAQITAAGSVFIGNYSPESVGDYSSGTNHTLPTYGWARSFSGINVDSFVRKITFQELSPSGLALLGGAVIEMANAEGLTAHANAIKLRLND
ncbi:MAG: histidinol dehydrogenase [Mucinivorans sp.]